MRKPNLWDLAWAIVIALVFFFGPDRGSLLTNAFIAMLAGSICLLPVRGVFWLIHRVRRGYANPL